MANRKPIMSEEDRFAFDTATELIEKTMRNHPEYFKLYVAPWAKKLEAECKLREKLEELRTFPEWSVVPYSMLADFLTEQSRPFIALCIQLNKRGYRHVPISLIRWWRRMIATAETNLITYFSWLNFHYTGCVICGTDIMMNCARTKDAFNDLCKVFDSDHHLDCHLRELLGGLGSNADIHEYWKKFCMKNHPDKGGDPQKFLEVKVCYDEWCAVNNKQKKD